MAIKVLMYGWELPPYNSGGLGVACLGLANSLSSRGVDLTFVLPGDQKIKGLKFKTIYAGIKDSDVLNGYTKIHSEDDSTEISSTSWELLNKVREYAARAGYIARKHDFDIVHAHDWLSYGAGISAKRAKNKPLAVHVHATEYDRNDQLSVNPTVCEIEKQGMKEADKVLTVSSLTAKLVQNKYGIPADKIDVVHNGLTPEDYALSKKYFKPMVLKKLGYKMVLFVGRVTYQKGPEYFLQAAKMVLRYNKKVYFVIAGSGDMYNHSIRLAAELGISDKVFFAGFVRGGELYSLYQQADVFVMPSVSDPYGLVAQEAMFFGTPVILSKTTGAAEILPNSLSVDFWDSEEIANKILSVLNYKALAAQLGDLGKKDALAQSWDKAADKCEQIYLSMKGN